MITIKRSENHAVSALSRDRDINAARRLVHLASGAGSRNACGGTASPGAARRVPVQRVPGTRKLGQTGTVVWQQTAAA